MASRTSMKVGRFCDHLKDIALVFDIFGTGLQGDLKDLVEIVFRRKGDQALTVERERRPSH